MNQPRPDIMAVFWEALDCPTSQQRAALLDRKCGQDSALRQKIEDLIRSHESAGNFLGGAAATVGEGPGTTIGPYRLLEQIGEGGMGLVFVAEQLRPVSRQVALKVIKPGMDTREVIARFEAERQTLALMDHPHIARVLDAGSTESGLPYFVMELVPGIAITEYADREQLSTKDRLRLFISVCQAVQHAHQKGIIHRDIKPSNVLVSSLDGKPNVKVIDFGVAKAVAGQLADHAVRTRFTQWLGTPSYMSPEQAEMSGADVDTRSDIYSLGMLLYELLCGATPFDAERMRLAGFDELRRIIREEDPPSLGQRLTTMGQAATTVCRNRGADAARLLQLLRGELNWVVAKAIDKDRSIRYQTAEALTADIRRYLNDEPLEAGPPSAGYKFRKFARRHRSILVGTAAAVMVILIGAIVTGSLALKARRAEKLAASRLESEIQARHESEQAQHRAETNLRKAREAVDQMLTRVSEQSLPQMSELEPIRRQLLEDALQFYQSLMSENANNAHVQHDTAIACLRVGQVYHGLGLSFDSERAYLQGKKLLEDLVQREPLAQDYWNSLAQMELGLGHLYRELGGRHEPSQQAYERARIIAEKLCGWEPQSVVYRHYLAQANQWLGYSLWQTSRLTQAELHYQMSRRLFSELVAEFPEDEGIASQHAFLHNSVGILMRSTGRPEEAADLHRAALDVLNRLIAADTAADYRNELARSYGHLGLASAQQGAFREAEAALLEALRIRRELVAQSPTSRHARAEEALTWTSLAAVREVDHRGDEAETAFRESIAKLEQLIADFPEVSDYRRQLAHALNRLAELLHARPDPIAAGDTYARLQLLAEQYRELDTPNSDTDNALAWFLVTPHWGPPEGALAASELAIRAVATDPGNGSYWNTLALVYCRRQQWTQAIEAIDKSISLQGGGDARDHFLRAMCDWHQQNHGQALQAYQQAIRWLEGNPTRSLELLRLRQETERLLGIPTAVNEP